MKLPKPGDIIEIKLSSEIRHLFIPGYYLVTKIKDDLVIVTPKPSELQNWQEISVFWWFDNTAEHKALFKILGPSNDH